MPEEARLQDSRLEFSHYQEVLDHYEQKSRQVEKHRITGYEEYVVGYRDLGNGYFEEITEQRPIRNIKVFTSLNSRYTDAKRT